MKIWYFYLFRRLIQSFFFLLLSLFILYITIDFSIRGMKILSHNATTFLDIALNYLRQFALYFDLFACLAFLLSSLKVLLDCSQHQELTALQMAALSKRRLLLPFFSLGLLLCLASHANHQWLSPTAGSEINAFREAHSSKKPKKERVFSLTLEDDSELVYQSFSSEKKEFFDVYWIRSPNDFWYMKTLKIEPRPPLASFTDRLVRNERGQFEKKESFATHFFSEILLDKEAAPQKSIPFESRSLGMLLKQALIPSSERLAILAHLHYKLAWPWVPFLILISIAPPAFSFSRNRSSFLLVSYSLFAFVGLTTLLNGMLILAENQVLSPALAIWGPLGFCFAWSLRSFLRC